ncbi:MAG: hypothetical protein C4540_04125 [Candidatus Omnitrophota bacterium]|jgi:tetratricopeptide (TPR) repeat protein|nr:MAG: hypothetical protein C4540_04125 [Candidatus Omnitrophota bacterium]
MASGNIFLIEDHDEALGIWRKKGVKGLDLIHLDAHLDFGVYDAFPIQEVILKARSLKELKESLEKSITYRSFQSDFSKQLNIGNYIYPAMQEGIVRNFYWVVPGKSQNLKKSFKLLKSLFKDIFRYPAHLQSVRFDTNNGRVKARLLGRNFVVCSLDSLPFLGQGVLLDIDTDCLVTSSLSYANATALIGKRKPWIQPAELVRLLKKKIKKPKLITVAYSVNGGYTPIKYRYLADEIAYCFAPQAFKAEFALSKKAAQYFKDFLRTQQTVYYRKAVALDRRYRAADNNYGPLYLSIGRLSQAKKEFLKIKKADPGNPACINGLGLVVFKRKDFREAKKLFLAALRHCQGALFGNIKKQALFNLGQARFGLKDYRGAERSLLRFRQLEPMHAESRYLLGLIFEKKGDYRKSAEYLQDALRLGLLRIEILEKLLKIAWLLDNKNAIIILIRLRLKELKRFFKKEENHNLKRALGKNSGVKFRIRRLEERLSETQKEVAYA